MAFKTVNCVATFLCRSSQLPIQGSCAITWATVAVNFLAYGTCRNSFGPCALLLGPSTPQTIIWARGKPVLNMFIREIVPPWPI